MSPIHVTDQAPSFTYTHTFTPTNGMPPMVDVKYVWLNSTMSRWRVFHNYIQKQIFADYPLCLTSQSFNLFGLPPEVRSRIFTIFSLDNFNEYLVAEKVHVSPLEEELAIPSDANRRGGWEHLYRELLPCRFVSRQFSLEFAESRAKAFKYELPEVLVNAKRFKQDPGWLATMIMEAIREFYRLMPEIERRHLQSAYIKAIFGRDSIEAGKTIRQYDAEQLAGLLESIPGMHQDFRLTVTLTVSKSCASSRRVGGVKRSMVFQPDGQGWMCENPGLVFVSSVAMKKWKVEEIE